MSVVKILKNGVAIIICAAAIFTALPHGAFAADDAGDLKIGDYICLGKYRGMPIIWRYAADDEHGKFILSDKIISAEPFDVSYGSSGSHARRGGQTASNYWEDSQIKSWLNSKAERGEVTWLCGAPPSHYEYYEYNKGFLSDENFSATERAAIKKVRQKTHISPFDAELADGGDADSWYSFYYNTTTKVFNEETYDNILYKYTDDMVFLPDLKQIQNVIKNADILGGAFIPSEYTIPAKKEFFDRWDEYTYEYSVLEDTPWGTEPSRYCLRDSYAFEDRYEKAKLTSDHGNYVFIVKSSYSKNTAYPDNYTINVASCDHQFGIRPAFYLNEDNIKILSGSGTENDPYVIDGITAPDDGNDGTISGTERTTPINDLIYIYVNGERLLAVSQEVIENNRVYIPLIEMPALFDCVIEHIDHKFEEVEMWTRNLKYSIKLNYYSNIIETKDGSRIEMDCYPKFMSDPLFVYMPLRAVVEQLGGIVEWVDDENGKRIYISIDTTQK